MTSTSVKRCRKKIKLNHIEDSDDNIEDEDNDDNNKSKYRLIYQKRSPPPSNSKHDFLNKSFIEDTSSDEEIFPVKRFKKAIDIDNVIINDSVVPTPSTSKNLNIQKNNLASQERTIVKKQKRVINKQANSIILTRKEEAITAKKNNVMTSGKYKQQKEMIYVSPSTKQTCQVLQNVIFSPSCTQRQLLQNNKNSPTPGSLSLEVPHSCHESRADSLSEISCSNLLDCDMQLNEDKINELLQTPEQKRKNLNVTSEYAQSEDSDTKSEKTNVLEVSVIIEKYQENINSKKQNICNNLPTIVKSLHIIDEDRIESISYDKNDLAKNSKLSKKYQAVESQDLIVFDGAASINSDNNDTTKYRKNNKKLSTVRSPDLIDPNGIGSMSCSKNDVDNNKSLYNKPQSIADLSDSSENIFDSDTDENYIPSSDKSSDSETAESNISKKCAGTELELSSEDSENEILNIEEPLPGSQINNYDADEWEDINESPVNFDEYLGESTLNVPPFAKSPGDIYKLFVTNEMINKMVSETNNYALNYLQANQRNKKPKSRIQLWTDTNFEEMKTFMAVLLAMGLCRVPYINLYWSKNKLYRNEFISSAMTTDRFLLLLKCWHVSNVSNEDRTDKLHKIRDMFTKLTDNFQTVLDPGKHVVIDETMIPWRGRLGFRQYIKNKSHRYGVKLYKLCTPEGYTYQIEVYTGKKDQKREVDHGQNVVLRLMNNLTDKGRIVIVDNYYTSLGLAEKLLLQKSFICGTLNVRRKHLPKIVTLSKLKKGQVIGKMNKKGVKVLKWVDKRPVLMFTTCKNHDDKLINTGKLKRGTNEPIEKPGCVLLYNQIKKGIDFSDQMSSYYTPLKKGVKWWRKVIMELLFGTALVNAWIVYNSINDGGKMPKREYVEKFIESLTGKDLDADTEPAIKPNKHHLVKGTKKRNCVGCYEKLRATLTSRQADKKVKKNLTECNTCKKNFCLDCYNEKH